VLTDSPLNIKIKISEMLMDLISDLLCFWMNSVNPATVVEHMKQLVRPVMMQRSASHTHTHTPQERVHCRSSTLAGNVCLLWSWKNLQFHQLHRFILFICTPFHTQIKMSADIKLFGPNKFITQVVFFFN